MPAVNVPRDLVIIGWLIIPNVPVKPVSDSGETFPHLQSQRHACSQRNVLCELIRSIEVSTYVDSLLK